MWPHGADTNKRDVPVRLYQPILYSGRVNTEDPTVSHIGGHASYFDTEHDKVPTCSNCRQGLFLLMQLYIPEQQRTVYVFGCNQASCVASLFRESAFSLSKGVFVCRQQSKATTITDHSKREVTVESQNHVTTSSWAMDETAKANDEANEWNVSNTDENDLDDVEAMVAKMEMGVSKAPVKPKPKRTAATKTVGDKPPSFPCYEIHGLQEPAFINKGAGDDDDDVGTTGGASDDKIQKMLARYMAEEEDKDILAALRGSTTGETSNSGSSKRGEKDERLPPADRAMLTFTDRIKRAPRQIARYAPGGLPLWSIPLPNASSHGDHPVSIPNCSCGSARQFEFQLMPSLLHVLNVDKFAPKSTDIEELLSREFGGMNWGVIAIYSCMADCDKSENVVVVQDSVDGTPEKRQGPTEDAMVTDNDRNDDDAMEELDNDDEFDEDCDDD